MEDYWFITCQRVKYLSWIMRSDQDCNARLNFSCSAKEKKVKYPSLILVCMLIEIIFFCYLTTDGTDGSFTQDFIMKNRLNYFTVDAKPFDVYEHPLQALKTLNTVFNS